MDGPATREQPSVSMAAILLWTVAASLDVSCFWLANAADYHATLTSSTEQHAILIALSAATLVVALGALAFRSRLGRGMKYVVMFSPLIAVVLSLCALQLYVAISLTLHSNR